jgi:hypothetical protein
LLLLYCWMVQSVPLMQPVPALLLSLLTIGLSPPGVLAKIWAEEADMHNSHATMRDAAKLLDSPSTDMGSIADVKPSLSCLPARAYDVSKGEFSLHYKCHTTTAFAAMPRRRAGNTAATGPQLVADVGCK